MALPFDFGDHVVTGQPTDYHLDAAITCVLDVAPARVATTGHTATVARVLATRLRTY